MSHHSCKGPIPVAGVLCSNLTFYFSTLIFLCRKFESVSIVSMLSYNDPSCALLQTVLQMLVHIGRSAPEGSTLADEYATLQPHMIPFFCTFLASTRSDSQCENAWNLWNIVCFCWDDWFKDAWFSDCYISDFCLWITGNVVWLESVGLWYTISYVN